MTGRGLRFVGGVLILLGIAIVLVLGAALD